MIALALAACAVSRSSVACACCNAPSSGRRSSVNNSCPATTSSPCWKFTAVSSPVICARTDTVEYASTVPTTLASSGIALLTAAATVTGTAGRRGRLLLRLGLASRATGSGNGHHYERAGNKGDAHQENRQGFASLKHEYRRPRCHTMSACAVRHGTPLAWCLRAAETRRRAPNATRTPPTRRFPRL